jgi:hypothetical protein
MEICDGRLARDAISDAWEGNNRFPHRLPIGLLIANQDFMPRFWISLGLTSLAFSAFLSAAGCLSDDDGSGDELCALVYSPPISLTLFGAQTRGAPAPAELATPTMQCQVSESQVAAFCAIGTHAGDYDFTIEAPGYEPLRVRTTVEPSTEACSNGFKAKRLAYDLVASPTP